MKCIVFGILLVVCSVDFGATEEESRTNILWNAWKKTYHKTYKSLAEEKQRLENFALHVELMDAINDKFAKGELPFNLTIYEYADTTREEFLKLRTGLRMPSQLDEIAKKRTKRESEYAKAMRRPSYPRPPPNYVLTPTTTTTIQPIPELISSLLPDGALNSKPFETTTASTTTTTTTTSTTASTTSNFLNTTTSSPPIQTAGQVAAPASVDWVAAGKVTSVKSQGDCGSCWAFAALAAMESQYLIKSGTTFDLSEQQLVNCDRQNYGCNGGWPYTTMSNYLKYTGVTTEARYPYKGTRSSCLLKSSWPRYKVTGQTLPYKLNGDEAALMDLVANYGPVVVAIHASPLFQMYRSGIFIDNTCNDIVNHGVVVVGYGTENGIDFWLVKNSWGSLWGEKGYIRMARNRNNQCKIASYGSVPILP